MNVSDGLFTNIRPNFSLEECGAYITWSRKLRNADRERLYFYDKDGIDNFQEDYYNCLKDGIFVPAVEGTPWLVELKVDFVDRKESIEKRARKTMNVVTPHLLYFIRRMGLSIVAQTHQDIMPKEMLDWFAQQDKSEPTGLFSVVRRIT